MGRRPRVPSEPTPDPLVERWKTDQGRALAAEAFRRLAEGERLDGLPLARHEGRVDLRGVIGPADPRSNRAHMTCRMGAVTLEGLDFSGAELPTWWLDGTTVLNCNFDGANVDGLEARGTRISDTSFRLTRGVVRKLGGREGGIHGQFRNVDFSRADLRRVNAISAEFVDCDFSHARVEKCEWWSSRFVRCRFAGLIRENIWIDRSGFDEEAQVNEMEDVDLSGAELRRCEFRHLVLDRVRMPEDVNHIVIRGDFRAVLTRAIEIVSPSRELALTGYGAVFQSRLKWLHPDCRVGVFNLKDLAESDRGKGLLAPLIRRVAAEVGATAT